MIRLTTILVPLDSSPLAERALPYAVELARASKGWLLLVRVTAPTGLLVPETERDVEVELGSVAAELRDSRIAVDTAICHAYDLETGRAIADIARRRRADLIVMSTHGRGGLRRSLFGSVADQVVRAAEVPLMLIPAASERRWPSDRGLRILVPLDGSALAEAALGPATELVTTLRAKLILLRVVEPPTSGRFSPEPALAEAREGLEKIVRRLRAAECSVSIHAVGGFAVPTIATFARSERADLIVMATHGRSGLARLALGSVASGTLQRATVPLMLMRPAAVRRSTEPLTSSKRSGRGARSASH
jgi:nucleotide-binding universal stress UspA family protein